MSHLVGLSFGTLTVVGEAKRSTSRKRRWLCVCRCGAERVVLEHNLKRGNTRSCGRAPCSTRWDWRRLPPGEQARTVIWLNYKSNAASKLVSFTITREQFDQLTALPCHYCGTVPANSTKDRWGGGAFIYSGLDRVDPSRGYDIHNVVPACIVCNRAKSDMAVEAFRAWGIRLARHQGR